MDRRFNTVIIIFTSVALIGFISIFTIIKSRSYYPGFEKGLFYFSPDLSESRTIFRDKAEIDKASEIKIIFERKNSTFTYEKDLLYSFLNDLVVQVWNDSEFVEYKNNIDNLNLDVNNLTEITIGSINGDSRYSIYIKSNYGVNYSYHIGVGIGVPSNKVYNNKKRSYF